MKKLSSSVIPREVKSLFFGSKKLHWEIIEFLLQNERVPKKTLDEKLQYSDLDEHIQDLQKSGWIRQIKPAGISVTDRNNFELSLSLFSKIALSNMLKCMDLKSYEEWKQKGGGK